MYTCKINESITTAASWNNQDTAAVYFNLIYILTEELRNLCMYMYVDIMSVHALDIVDS